MRQGMQEGLGKESKRHGPNNISRKEKRILENFGFRSEKLDKQSNPGRTSRIHGTCGNSKRRCLNLQSYYTALKYILQYRMYSFDSCYSGHVLRIGITQQEY